MADVVLSGDAFFKGATTRFQQVSFSDPKGIAVFGVTINRKFAKVPGANPDDLETVLNEAQRVASHEIAKQARRRMAGWFNPASNHYSGIGSEKTARGLSVPRHPQGSPGAVLYMVRERRRSLRLIRQGLPPGSKGPHRGPKPEGFMEWVDEKGLEYKGKPERGSKATAYRMANYVYQHGMSDYWAKNVPMAEGHRYFNYPQYYNKRWANADAESVIHKLLTGDTKKGFHAAVALVTLGVITSAKFQVTGKDSFMGMRNYLPGTVGSGRLRTNRIWQNMEANFLTSDAEFDETFKGDDPTWSYVTRIRKKIKGE